MAVIVLGDIHGEFHHILNVAEQMSERDTLIQVGDFGLFSEKDLRMGGWLSENCKPRILAIRGNHDNPALFDGRTVGNLTLLKDYTHMEIEGKPYLFAGGAISIDRKLPFRKEGINWFSDEEFNLPRNSDVDIDSLSPDILITHAGPPSIEAFLDPLPKYTTRDSGLEGELNHEHEKHLLLSLMVEPIQWFFGHYHKSVTTTAWRCLDIAEAAEVE